MITTMDLQHWFSYHAPKEGQQEKYEAIRQAGLRLAIAITENSSPCPDQTAAVRKVREAVMTANECIAWEGR
jgi:hypothetical protein